MPDATLTESSPAGGLLVAAYDRGETLPLSWVEVRVRDLIVTVASDAMKATVLGRAGVRLPATYEESVRLCRALGCVAPDVAICNAMFAQAAAPIGYVGLVKTSADERRMRTVSFTLRFNERVEAKIATHATAPGALVFGAWKLWIMHRELKRRGAVNYGFWSFSTKPPSPIQTPGARHDARHYDYSQLFQPVQRYARKADGGATVDLLDEFARVDAVSARFLDAYRT